MSVCFYSSISQSQYVNLMVIFMHYCPRGGFASQGEPQEQQPQQHACPCWAVALLGPHGEIPPNRARQEWQKPGAHQHAPSPRLGPARKAGQDGEGVLTAIHSLWQFHFSKEQALLNDLGACINVLN